MASNPTSEASSLATRGIRKIRSGNDSHVSVLSLILILATTVFFPSSRQHTWTVNAKDFTPRPIRNARLWGRSLWDQTTTRRPWRSTSVQFPIQGPHDAVAFEALLDHDAGIALPILSTNGVQSSLLSHPSSLTKAVTLAQSLMDLRGGQQDDGEVEYDDEEEDDTEASGEGIDYAAVVDKVIDVTKTKVIPVVVRVTRKTMKVLTRISISTYYAMKRAIQAGREGDDEEDDDDGSVDDDDAEVTMMDRVLKYAMKTMKIVKRMVQAAMDFPETEGSEEEETDDGTTGEEEDTLVVETKAKVKKLKKEKADKAVDDDGAGDDDDDDSDGGSSIAKTSSSADVEELVDSSTGGKSSSTTLSSSSDLGAALAKEYDVEDKRDEKHWLEISGGSLNDGLQRARSQARMLIVFIPAESPDGGAGNLFKFFGGRGSNAKADIQADQSAVESLLSVEVAKAANKKSRKSGPADLGSFAIWTAKAGSSEAVSAIKRLKVKASSAKGEKRPILCVVYPAYVSALDSSGLPKIVPTVLAEHHCNPPPDAATMASWMSSIRKRHANEYKKMQSEKKELELFKNRQAGYKESIQSDKERKRKEAKEAAEQKAKEEAAAAHKAAIGERRKELLSSLPEEQKGAQVKKIALRFADGKKGQRNFSPDTPLSVIFNWVDAMFEMERETVVLTTQNGKQTFSWEEDGTNEMTLEEAELGKMTAFRVTEKNQDESTSANKASSSI